MPDQMILTIVADNTSPFTLTQDSTAAFVLTSLSGSTVTLQMGATLTGTTDLTGPSSLKGFESFVADTVSDNEIITSVIVPYAFTANPSHCSAYAIDAPVGTATFLIFKTVGNSTTQVGTVTFAANSHTGTVALTSTSFSKGDLVYIQAPTGIDQTIANITFLVAE
jgi:hypothetical protein